MDSAKHLYQKQRMANWDQVALQSNRQKKFNTFYHKLLQHYYKFLIPQGLNILEMGCGRGELLASLNPSFGVGFDFSRKMVQKAAARYPHLHFFQADAHEIALNKKFDIIILSDLINDLWDVQCVFEKIRPLCTPRTRVILNAYNNLWRIPLAIAKYFKMGSHTLVQNWFMPQDIINLMSLSGFETITIQPHILLPFEIKYLATLINRYLVNILPFKWFALTNFYIVRPSPSALQKTDTPKPNIPSVSVIIPARNEAGNICDIFKRVPDMGRFTELIFVEGHSTDNTYDTIAQFIKKYPHRKSSLLRQTGKGKGDAVRLGFEKASGDILMILDTDMTVPPEDLTRFFKAISSGTGEFINGVRLIYPMEDRAMRFINMIGNKFFSLMFSWLLGQPIKDTLCGTKVLKRTDYAAIAKNREYFGDFDPFGDFDLLFGAAKLNLKIVEIPIRYRNRTYGSTNIDRWRHGWLLIKMVVFAAKKIKFI